MRKATFLSSEQHYKTQVGDADVTVTLRPATKQERVDFIAHRESGELTDGDTGDGVRVSISQQVEWVLSTVAPLVTNVEGLTDRGKPIQLPDNSEQVADLLARFDTDTQGDLFMFACNNCFGMSAETAGN